MKKKEEMHLYRSSSSFEYACESESNNQKTVQDKAGRETSRQLKYSRKFTIK